jgi:hypothetical protein
MRSVPALRARARRPCSGLLLLLLLLACAATRGGGAATESATCGAGACAGTHERAKAAPVGVVWL